MPRHGVIALGVGFVGAQLLTASVAAAPADWWETIEADWFLQAERRALGRVSAPAIAAKPEEDAPGGVDGVKDGKWGFHTGQDNPAWWQVDLSAVQGLAKVLIYNRCDIPARAAPLGVLLSEDGKSWKEAYRHDGTPFLGATDKKPLAVDLEGAAARYVRIQVPGPEFLHLDEVEVYGTADPAKNIALGRAATQSSASPWSVKHGPPRLEEEPRPVPAVGPIIERGRRLAADLREAGLDTRAGERTLDDVERLLTGKIPPHPNPLPRRGEGGTPSDPRRPIPSPPVGEGQGGGATGLSRQQLQECYLRARWAVRDLVLASPLLDFDRILFVKRVPGSYSHMSDQYYGWWSRPGGGLCILEGFKGGTPRVRCLTEGLPPGSVMSPDLSYDGTRALFAWCRYYPETARNGNKVNKAAIPEDAFYHVFEINIDGTGLRQLTRGRYDDFDPRYLPNGEIAFLSTRRGQFVQCGRSSAAETVERDALPDSYVRCGGGNGRPVAVYTLHVMDAQGGRLRQISAFENFEWTPSVAADGRLLHARWDYVDRSNMPFMSLWSVNPDGTNPQAVFGNFTGSPHCVFEARSIPGSRKMVFTASAHHSITGGSLVLVDPDAGRDGQAVLTRLTPEVRFPEIEGWPATYFAGPWPLSERYFLAAWSAQPLRSEGGANPANALGLYFFDAFGNLELLYRDPEISSMNPIPLRPRPRPPVRASAVDWNDALEGRFFLLDVYQGLAGVERGSVKGLRIVAVPAKTQPQMNSPNLGVTGDDPGKCVLGTVPVEPDGSAHFRAPAGVNLFFQALDGAGMAVQTMRTVTYVQPGQTLSCVGCHEPRNLAPPVRQALAASREPSRITVGPEGSWPLRFDRLVQPVLDRSCARCHRADGTDPKAARLDLAADQAYRALVTYGSPSLAQHVRSRYGAGRSVAGTGPALSSPVLGQLRSNPAHKDLRLSAEDLERLITWMDTYGQVRGSFCAEQEAYLLDLRNRWAEMLTR